MGLLDVMRRMQGEPPPEEIELQSVVDLLTPMVFAERDYQSGEKDPAMISHTILNRAKSKRRGEFGGPDLVNVLLKDDAFSARDSARYRNARIGRFKNDIEQQAFDATRGVVERVLRGMLDEYNMGQTNYYNPEKANPSWGNSPLMEEVGHTLHRFLRYKE